MSDVVRDLATLARNVRRAREIRGWTRGRLCSAAGISPQTLAKVEGGGGCADRVERKLAEALGTVVGRLWEPLDLQRYSVHTPATDRWYFANHADGERYWRARGFVDATQAVRYDPEPIQDATQRARMGQGGLASGFVRVTTGHLQAGSVISSLIELYGRVESRCPEHSFAYYYVVRVIVRLQAWDDVHTLGTGDVFQAEMGSNAWLEPAGDSLETPLVAFVDLAVRFDRSKV